MLWIIIIVRISTKQHISSVEINYFKIMVMIRYKLYFQFWLCYKSPQNRLRIRYKLTTVSMRVQVKKMDSKLDHVLHTLNILVQRQTVSESLKDRSWYLGTSIVCGDYIVCLHCSPRSHDHAGYLVVHSDGLLWFHFDTIFHVEFHNKSIKLPILSSIFVTCYQHEYNLQVVNQSTVTTIDHCI